MHKRTLTTTLVLSAFLAGLAIATGCTDSPLAVGANFKLNLIANPSSVNVDPSNPGNTATSTLVASVVDGNGVPQKGYAVIFSSDGGALSSGTSAVTTDSSGNAYDTLTVGVSDGTTINITATCSTLSATAKVTKNTIDPCANNTAPTAVITGGGALPSGQLDATLNGSGSTDPETSITNYAWDCGNGVTDAGPNLTQMTCTYAGPVQTPQTKSVKLTVTDAGLPDGTCKKTATATVSVILEP